MIKFSYCNSWSYCVDAFKDVLKKLRTADFKEDENHQLINVSSGKYVYHCKDGSFDYAYKTQQGKTFWRYIISPSLPLREFTHYQQLAAINLPIPEVLAVGDTRKFFVLKESFIITSYIENTFDGRTFMPGGKFCTGFEDLRKAFSAILMKQLAHLHNNGYFHKAAHPRNFLFRGDNPSNIEVFWIDVARMRKATNLRFATTYDLKSFFHDMKLPKNEVLELLDIYLSNLNYNLFSNKEDLLNQLCNFKRRRFSKRKYTIYLD